MPQISFTPIGPSWFLSPPILSDMAPSRTHENISQHLPPLCSPVIVTCFCASAVNCKEISPPPKFLNKIHDPPYFNLPPPQPKLWTTPLFDNIYEKKCWLNSCGSMTTLLIWERWCVVPKNNQILSHYYCNK